MGACGEGRVRGLDCHRRGLCAAHALVELAGWGCLAAATCSFLISTACNYLASMRYVFRRREDMGRMREASTFLAFSLAGLMLNDACMYILVAGGIDYLMAKVAAAALVMAWNFGSRKALLDAGGWGGFAPGRRDRR